MLYSCLINHTLLLLQRSVHTCIPVKQGEEVLHSPSQIISFSYQCNSLPPYSSNSTCCGVFSRKPESKGKTAACLPTYQPYYKSRADVQGESQGTQATYRGLLFTESTWWVTDGYLSKRADHQLILTCNHVLESSLSKRTFLCLISNHL